MYNNSSPINRALVSGEIVNASLMAVTLAL